MTNLSQGYWALAILAYKPDEPSHFEPGTLLMNGQSHMRFSAISWLTNRPNSLDEIFDR